VTREHNCTFIESTPYCSARPGARRKLNSGLKQKRLLLRAPCSTGARCNGSRGDGRGGGTPVGRRQGRRVGHSCGHELGGRSLQSGPLPGRLAVGGGLVAAAGAPAARLRVAAGTPAIVLLAVVGVPAIRCLAAAETPAARLLAAVGAPAAGLPLAGVAVAGWWLNKPLAAAEARRVSPAVQPLGGAAATVNVQLTVVGGRPPRALECAVGATTGGGRRGRLASNPLGRRHGLDVLASGPRLQRFRLALLVGQVLVCLHEHESLLVGVRPWGVGRLRDSTRFRNAFSSSSSSRSMSVLASHSRRLLSRTSSMACFILASRVARGGPPKVDLSSSLRARTLRPSLLSSSLAPAIRLACSALR
jgi:hypothetical protein